MIVTTTDSIEGYEITDYLGIVFDAYFFPYSDTVDDCDLVTQAVKKGANAVVGVTFSAASDVSGYCATTEINCIAMGTAVKIRKK